MTLRLDLSPMFVNRTAAYHLCSDVRAIATSCGVKHSLQFFGHPHDTLPSDREVKSYLPKFFQQIHDGRFPEPTAQLWADAESERTLYMDPLYVLFGQLRPSDIVVLLDLSPLTHPQWHNPATSRAYQAAMHRILQIRPALAAISQNTIDTFETNYGRYDTPIRHVTLYPPAFIRDGLTQAKPLSTPWPYFLFVGSLEIRKNMGAAIAAFAHSGLAEDGFKLLIVGGHGHGADDIQAKAAATEGVILAGFLTAREVCAAYAGATGFIYPSYLEGFGVPLLEAMSFGVPCVASTTGACPEVGGPDVPTVDPDDHACLASHLRRFAFMAKADRETLGANLQSRASKEFSFDAFSSQIRDLLGA